MISPILGKNRNKNFQCREKVKQEKERELNDGNYQRFGIPEVWAYRDTVRANEQGLLYA